MSFARQIQMYALFSRRNLHVTNKNTATRRPGETIYNSLYSVTSHWFDFFDFFHFFFFFSFYFFFGAICSSFPSPSSSFASSSFTHLVKERRLHCLFAGVSSWVNLPSNHPQSHCATAISIVSAVVPGCVWKGTLALYIVRGAWSVVKSAAIEKASARGIYRGQAVKCTSGPVWANFE